MPRRAEDAAHGIGFTMRGIHGAVLLWDYSNRKSPERTFPSRS